jgi:hypothetical protein
MSTVIEIESALELLSDEELRRVQRAVQELYRRRHGGIVYDDENGIVTEAELIASAEEAFLQYDKEEEARAQRPTR